MSTNQVQWFGLPQARVGDVYCSVTVLNQSSLVLEESHFLLGGSDARLVDPLTFQRHEDRLLDS